MTLPPGILATRLIQTFPQFVVCSATLNQTIQAQLNPIDNPDVQDLVAYLQSNPDEARAAGDVLAPPDEPATTVRPLADGLVQATGDAVLPTSAWIIGQDAFEDVAWTVQSGTVPGPETPQAADGSWVLTTRAPVGGLAFPSIAYSGDGERRFTITAANDLPRHLSVYATFLKDDVPVVPAGWQSRLPKGVPSGFETDTVKYVDFLVPVASVAGINLGNGPRELSVTLPENADSVRLQFGGLDGAGFSGLPDAAGVFLTAVLDIFVPWLIVAAGLSGNSHAAWFRKLIADTDIAAEVIAAGFFLAQGVNGTDAMLDALSENLTGALQGTGLTALRKSIDAELGSPTGKDYTYLDQFAPAAGWAAQLLKAFLAGGMNAQYWPVSIPSPIALTLTPSTTMALTTTLLPDPVSGLWPYAAQDFRLSIAYGGGFSQQLTGTVPAPGGAASLAPAFGSVPNGGPILVQADVLDAGGARIASTSGSVTPAVGAGRNVEVRLAVEDRPTVIDGQTLYQSVSTLLYRDGAFAWQVGSPRSAAVALQGGLQGAARVVSLQDLTVQSSDLCIGYAWGVENQSVQQCGGGATLQTANFVQNVGTAVPADELRTTDCGLVVPALLTYSNDRAAPLAPGSGGFYLDTQHGFPYLRPVAFGAGRFDTQGTTSFARFWGTTGPRDIAVSNLGHAALVSLNQNILQVVRLSAWPVADGDAPVALSVGGSGTRVGLLSNPVAVAATPTGLFLVLEDGNARLQAFDADGNPVAVFNGTPVLTLRAMPSPKYLDLAVSPAGLIYVLGTQNGGTVAADFLLDIYRPDGTHLSTTSGVNAAKIAVDAAQTLYTLNFDQQAGPAGRLQPTVSAWRP